MDIVQLIADLDQAPDLHLARLLLLLHAFSQGKSARDIEGLTKLAKLDFLLRYPVMLEKSLEAKRRSIRDVDLQDYERYSVESEMVRYRFGPWDHRYREFINILVAKGLVSVDIDGRTVMISLTDKGRVVAENLSDQDDFKHYVRRARLLKTHFDIKGSNLMKFIYDTFPEILTLRSNERISL